jgi:sugar phosphate isomerase/epimerase
MLHALKRAKAFGYSGIELRDFQDIDLSSVSGVAHALTQASELVPRLGLTLTSLFYGPLPVSRGDERAAEEREFCKILALLADHGVKILHTRLSLHAPGYRREIISAEARENDYSAVEATLKRVALQAERFGVRVALETHMGTIHDTAASQLRIVSAIDSSFLTASLDFANMLIAYRGEQIYKTIRLFGHRIGYTHIKNLKLLPIGYDWNIPVRWGDINYFQVFQALKDVSYMGPVAVEYCGTGDPDVYAEDDARYIRDLVARVGL